MPSTQTRDELIGFVVVWTERDEFDSEHEEPFNTLRAAEKFSDETDGSVVYAVRRKADGSHYRQFVY